MGRHSSTQDDEAGSHDGNDGNPYERERAQRIARNKAVMASLGLDEAPKALRRATTPQRRPAPAKAAAKREPAAPTRRSCRLRNEQPAFGPDVIGVCGPRGPSQPIELTNFGAVPEAWHYEYRGPRVLDQDGEEEEGEGEGLDTPEKARARKRGRPVLSPAALAARKRAGELSKEALKAKNKGDVAAHHQLNYDRIRSMTIAALMTRARRITNKGKMVSFLMVLEDLDRPEHARVLEIVRERLQELH